MKRTFRLDQTDLIRNIYKDKSGIYEFINKISDKRYIGSAVCLYRRFNEHVISGKSHSNVPLQRAFKKYGIENFKFHVIEVVNDKKILIQIEQYYIDKFPFRELYNVRPKADSPLGTKHSDATKKKISIARTGKSSPPGTGAKISKANKGKTRSPEARANCQKAQDKRKNIPRSKETIDKMKAADKSSLRRIVQFNLGTGKKIKEFRSIITAAEFLNADPAGIRKCCVNKAGFAYGYIWRYFEDSNESPKKLVQFSIISRAKPTAQINAKTGKILKVFRTVKEASTYIGLSNSAITNAIKKNNRTNDSRYKWKHITPKQYVDKIFA